MLEAKQSIGGVAILALSALLSGCGTDEPLLVESGSVGLDDAAHDELVAVHVDKYFGKFEPDRMDSFSTFDLYTFNPRDDGPTCIYGSAFRVSVRDIGSEDLQIYLQGGGACWSTLCAANTDANAGILPIGWTDPDPERNPTLAKFNVVYVAYCDGSVHSGDNIVYKADGSIDRRHRGLANLSAALDIAKKRFPSPRRIVLSGSSAGGYGTILGTAVVRLAYPHTRLFVVNDAGPGLSNPADPSLAEAAKNEWKVTQFIPPSCEGCAEGYEFTPIIKWGLDHDPSLRASLFCAQEDAVIGGAFLKMQGPDFQKLLLDESGKVHAAHPDRFERFLWQGTLHTAILAGYYDREIDGISVIDFTTSMLDGGPHWRDLVE